MGRGNVALIALDPGDLIICPRLLSAQGRREREGEGDRERESSSLCENMSN